MACASPLPRTQFLGATIIGFSANAGWNGSQGELVCDVINDTCNGGGVYYQNDGNGDAGITVGSDSFSPPPLGYPVTFRYGGFLFSGLLQNWKETNTANGAKKYRARIVDPRAILEGTQVILSAYTGETYGLPGLENVFGWLEHNYGISCPEVGSSWLYPPMGMGAIKSYRAAQGFGAVDSEAGLTWGQIYLALNYLLNLSNNSQDLFGGPCQYRDHYYKVDLSELPSLDENVLFSDDSISLANLIHQVCEYANHDYYYSLQNHNTIKVHTVDRSWQANDMTAYNLDTALGLPTDVRLNIGSIGGSIGDGTGYNSTHRGVELREAYTNAFLVGEYRQDVWQTDFSGSTPFDATIWPYWGKDQNGSVIPGYGIGTADMQSEHYFTVSTEPWKVGFSTTYTITSTEMRLALAGQTQWQNYIVARQPELVSSGLVSEDELPADPGDFLWKCLDYYSVFPKQLHSNSKTQAQFAHEEAVRWPVMDQIYKHVHQYASSFFGKKYLVSLPFLCAYYDLSDAALVKNWDIASDGGWFEGSVLGLLPGSVYLEYFMGDDGRVSPFVGFNTAPNALDLSAINDKSHFIQINPYVAYLRCSVDEIVMDSFGTWRAVITLPGYVSTYNVWSQLQQILGMYAMARVRYGNSLDPNVIYELSQMTGADKSKYDMAPMPQMPTAAAIPMRSKRFTYGPWAATVRQGGVDWSDPTNTAGKTDYQRNSEFAPWNFGSMTRLNLAGDAYARTRLSNHYVIEQGKVSVVDAPATSLGGALFGGGPLVTKVDVSVGMGPSPVTTNYHMKTYTPDYGRLGQQYISAIKRAGQQARKANRMFRVWALEKYKAVSDQVFSHWNQRARWSVRYNTGSSHDILAGHYGGDPEDWDTSQCNVVTTELRKHLPELCATNDERYNSKASMDMNGLLRPFSTSRDDWKYRFPTFSETHAPNERDMDKLTKHTYFYTKDQCPPIWCKEPHLPITIETLSPFLSNEKATNGLELTDFEECVGHDIEFITRDGVYPTYLSVRRPEDNYSEDHWYRAMALRGPLILAGWGFDTDNKPVPNAGGEYGTQLAFEKDWLRKPHTWKVGPVDLRWDHRRQVWTAPAEKKIVWARLCGPLIPAYCTPGIIISEGHQLDEYGSPLPYESCQGSTHSNGKVPIHWAGCRPIPEGVIVPCYWDTTWERYYCLYGPDPIFDLTVTNNAGTGNAYVTINRMLGCNQGAIGGIGQIINGLGQSFCKGQTVLGYLMEITPTVYEGLCDAQEACVLAGAYYFAALQAGFKAMTLVSSVELIECPKQDTEELDCSVPYTEIIIDCDIGDDSDDPYADCDCEIDCEALFPKTDVDCDDIIDNWMEYKLYVKTKKIYVQSWECVPGDDPERPSCDDGGSPGDS